MTEYILDFGRKRLMLMTKYSRVITIPAIWIKSHKLKNKMFVQLYMDKDKNLIITPVKDRRVKNERKKR